MKNLEYYKSVLSRIFYFISESEMNIENARVFLARLDNFEPYQVFNYLDIK